MRSGRADGIAGGGAEPALEGPVVDLRPSGALLDLGDLATANASARLTVGTSVIWFTPRHGAVVDLASAEPRALPAPRPSPVRVLPPERPAGTAISEALAEVRERLVEQHVVHVVGQGGPVAGLLCALGRDGAEPTASVIHLDARGAVLSDILQVLFELLVVGPAASIASAEELRAGLGASRALVLLRDASLTVSETLTLGDMLRRCRVVLAYEGEPWLEDSVARVDGPVEDLGAFERRVTSLRGPEVHALEVLIAAGGDPIHDQVVTETVGGAGAVEALQVLDDLGLIERDGPWNRSGSSASLVRLDRLRPERWRATLATAIANWAHGARASEAAWSRGAGGWRRAHAWLLRNEAGSGSDSAARRLEEDVALARRWGAWRGMLLDLVDHAEATGDTAARAWALHQLGCRALCLGDRIAARACLAEARDLRWRTGDRAGAAVTQHNLALAMGSGNAGASRRSRLGAWASRGRGRRREPNG